MAPFNAFAWSVMLVVSATAVGGCGATAQLAVADGTGAQPVLPAPRRSMVPTVNVVTARGWTGDQKPTSAEGTTVTAFARGLDHPRWLHVLPNGDVLVAEANAPPRPQYARGIKGWFLKRYQKKAGGG